ncbi:MAG: hypothetical protein R2881_00200 [Eubacteriales bacterium]
MLLMKAKILPKWLALWGTGLPRRWIMIGVPLTMLGAVVPTFVLAPYVPFEFFTGAYMLVRYRKSGNNAVVAVQT